MNKKTAYSSMKYVHLIDKVEDLKNNKIIAPQFVMLYPMNACNHLCTFCAYRKTDLDKGYLADNVNLRDRLSNELLLDLPRQLSEAGVKAVEVTGGGEATLHPKIKDFFRELKKYDIEGALVTNGSTLDDEMIDLIKDFAWVRFSINGDGEGYEKIQAPSPNKKFLNIDQIWEQIRKLNRVKSKKTVVGVSCVVTRHFSVGDSELKTVTNADGLYEVARKAFKYGCDNVRFSLAFSQNGTDTYDDIWPTVSRQMADAKRDFDKSDFTVFTLANDRREDKEINKVGKDYDECRFIHFNTVINAAGQLTPCCTVSYSPEMVMGSLYEKEFKDIWFSKERYNFSKNIDVNKGLCGTSCFQNAKNKLLEYMCEEEPLHINFP